MVVCQRPNGPAMQWGPITLPSLEEVNGFGHFGATSNSRIVHLKGIATCEATTQTWEGGPRKQSQVQGPNSHHLASAPSLLGSATRLLRTDYLAVWDMC